MAFIAGNLTAPDNLTLAPASSIGFKYFAAGYAVVGPYNITGVGIQISDWLASSRIVVGVYDPTGNTLLGVGTYTNTATVGVFVVPLDTPIVSPGGSTMYRFGMMSDNYIGSYFNQAAPTYSADTNVPLTVTGSPPYGLPSTVAPGSDPESGFGPQYIFLDGTPVVTATVLGGLVGHRRPVGRGPAMNRNITVFQRTQGANIARQILLQLFSSTSPLTPLANTPVTLWTCLNEAGPAIDGPIQLTTDSQGYVLLQSLAIPAVVGQVRCTVTGDPSRSENLTVQF